jgi:iron complex transport system permease protein
MAGISKKSFVAAIVICGLLLAVMILISPGIGRQDIGIVDAWRSLFDDKPNTIHHAIAWQIRFPRTLMALLAGSVLALCGAVFQTLFRNPLATPYTVGIASGASLGALICYKLHWVTTILGISSVSIGALAGAIGVLLVVLLLARSAARITGNTLLLAGVTIGFFCSGMMMFITSLADVSETHKTVRWLMGTLDTYGHVELTMLLPLTIPPCLLLLWFARDLNQYSVGSELAAARGVRVERLEIIAIVAGSLAVSAIVSMCGPIGFVGLIIPHLVRLAFGFDHRIVLPASILLGGSFLIGCDFLTALAPHWYGQLTHTATTTARLPIGVMTAIVGTPVFLILLCTRRS